MTYCRIRTMACPVAIKRAFALIALAQFAATVAAPSCAVATEVTANRATPPNTPLGFHYNSVVINCAGVSDSHISHPATVVALERPVHGDLRIFEGQAHIRRCGGNWGNSTVVVYTPEHNFVGSDSFQLRVLFPLRGYTDNQRITAHVQVGGAGKPKR